MRSAKLHGICLLAAIVLAFVTWLPARRIDEADGAASFWSRDTLDVISLSYRSGSRTLDITRRSERGASFLWGLQTSARPAGDSVVVDTLYFPVGIAGSALMRTVADLRAVRDLGVVTSMDTSDYGLREPFARLVVAFSDERRVFEIGDSVYGQSNRFAREIATGRTLVLPAELVAPLAVGVEALRERQLHRFGIADVARVALAADGRERVMLRGGEGGDIGVWTSATDSGRSEASFTDFMERVGQLTISAFDHRVDRNSLRPVLRIDYFDGEDVSIGFLDLFSDPSDGTYYLWSERTRVAAIVAPLYVAPVMQRLERLF